jgi:hypothetical protein
MDSKFIFILGRLLVLQHQIMCQKTFSCILVKFKNHQNQENFKLGWNCTLNGFALLTMLLCDFKPRLCLVYCILAQWIFLGRSASGPTGPLLFHFYVLYIYQESLQFGQLLRSLSIEFFLSIWNIFSKFKFWVRL